LKGKKYGRLHAYNHSVCKFDVCSILECRYETDKLSNAKHIYFEVVSWKATEHKIGLKSILTCTALDEVFLSETPEK
jgi:hypothetical protein